VSDTGIGISHENQAHLFRKFSQVDSSSTRKYHGTGLGLAISKQLVSMMDGDIGVQSKPGEGSTFWFTARFSMPLERRQPPASNALRGRRMLCVDHSATRTRLLETLLRAWGVQVDCVADGTSVVAHLQTATRTSHPYDLVLLDQQLPGTTGIALARSIKSDAALASTRLVVMTHLGHAEFKAEAERIGVHGYLTKPIRESILHDGLITALGLADDKTRQRATRRMLTSLLLKFDAQVLVVEDNAVNQRLAVRMLEQRGCRVDVALNGREAVDVSGRIAYDCIFMDCQMPDMDGFVATAAIREREAQTGIHVPIIAMTANALQGDRERCYDAGMDDYVAKPAAIEDLVRMLDKWIR
jgi:CheY-like chemotaxis protein